MWNREQWRAFIDHPVVEWSIFVLGLLLMIAAIPFGALPGPGGIFVFAAGLALVLKTSLWARRRYARFKRWRFKLFGRSFAPGSFTDWALRRRSALRRERIRKEREELEKAQQTIAGD
jgi:hypothetical protein